MSNNSQDLSKKSDEISISVVLPNYNGIELLKANLPSLFESLRKGGKSFEVIVSDDCSSDDSVFFLQENYPDIKIVQNEYNRGFSVNCNVGAKEARGEFICISNTDVVFDIDYFIKAQKYFKDEKLFAVKGSIFNYRESIKKPINRDTTALLTFKRGFYRFTDPSLIGQVDYDLDFPMLGCCFICRTKIFFELCGFDEIFSPFYWEDSDLAIRAINKGWKVAYIEECIVYHQFSSTIEKTQTDYKRSLVGKRNKFLFTWKHLSSLSRWSNHILWQLISLSLRWLLLDWKYYTSFFKALYRKSSFKYENSILAPKNEGKI